MKDYRKARKFVRAFKDSVLENNPYMPWYTWPHNVYLTWADEWEAEWDDKSKNLVEMEEEYWREIEAKFPYEVFIPYREYWNCDEVVEWLKEYAGTNWAYKAIQCDSLSEKERKEWAKTNREGTIFRFADPHMGLMFKVAWG